MHPSWNGRCNIAKDDSRRDPASIEKVRDADLCVLCGTCVSACPSKAIAIPFGREYRLELAKDKCTACGNCLAVCPGIHVRNYSKRADAPGENYYLGSFHSIYTGYSCDFSRRYNGSSGGLVSEVLLFLLENKIVDAAILTGFAAASALQPEGFLARNREDVLAAAGSKYSPVPLNVLLRELDFSKRYAYVGLPCHIQGLDLFLRQRKMDAGGDFIKLGLFCSRTNRLQATKLLLRLNGLSPDVLKGIRYRGKGHPGFFSTVDRCGNQKKIHHLDDTYWGLLFKKYFVQYRCWLCPDKTAFFSDLSFGDDWSRSFYEDIVGTSSVIARSERGAEIIQRMLEQGRVSLNALDPKQLVRSQALSEKMNILKRNKIAVFFGQAIPQYEGFNFQKEKSSLLAEILMYFRIRVQDSRLGPFVVHMDLLLSKEWRRLKNLFHIRLFLTRLRRAGKRIFRPAGKAMKVKEKKSASIGRRPVPPRKVKRPAYRLTTIGGYGYNDVGDEAMPKAIIANLQERFAGHLAITMLSPDPGFTAAYHGYPSGNDIVFSSDADDIAGLNFERERYLRWATVAVRHRLRAFFLTAVNFRLPFFKLLRTIAASDGLLNVGGGNLNSIMRKELYKRTTLHAVAKTLGKKVYVSGQTIGPFYNDNDRSVAMESLDAVDVLTFRDKQRSAELAASLGITRPVMYDAGDDALTLASIGKDAASRLLKDDSSAVWFGLPARHTWALNLKASLKMFKGAGRSADLSSEIVRLARISEYILNHYDARILLVPTDYCPGADDRLVLGEVREKIRAACRERVNLLQNVYSDHELKGILACCDFALGVRYHFSVFALAQFVPTIGIASGEYQRTKLKGILQLLDLEEYYIPEDMEFASLDNIIGTIDKMVTAEKTIREKLSRNVPPLMAESTKIVGHIFNDLTTPGNASQ